MHRTISHSTYQRKIHKARPPRRAGWRADCSPLLNFRYCSRKVTALGLACLFSVTRGLPLRFRSGRPSPRLYKAREIRPDSSRARRVDTCMLDQWRRPAPRTHRWLRSGLKRNSCPYSPHTRWQSRRVSPTLLAPHLFGSRHPHGTLTYTHSPVVATPVGHHKHAPLLLLGPRPKRSSAAPPLSQPIGSRRSEESL